jgi:RimJ/RimL family protein N-acetyltransferase
MYRIYGNPGVVRWVGDGIPLSRELCQRWIEISITNYQTKGFGASAIIEKLSGNFIGCCGIVYGPGSNRPEIIYAFEPKFWGKGYGSEVVPAILDYGFEHFQLAEIIATIDPENQASARILLKSGMQFFGEETVEDSSKVATYVIQREARR